MKRIFMVVVALVMMAATSFAQDAVPATKVNGKSDLDTLLQPLMEKLKDVADDDDEQAAKIIFDFAKENSNEAGVYVITNLPRNPPAHTYPFPHNPTTSLLYPDTQPRNP